MDGARAASGVRLADRRLQRPEPARARLGGRLAAAALDQRGQPSLGEVVGDDHPLDLAGTLPDPLDPEFAGEPFGDVLAHVATATEDLDGSVGDASCHLRAVELGHRATRVRDLAVDALVHGPSDV